MPAVSRQPVNMILGDIWDQKKERSKKRKIKKKERSKKRKIKKKKDKKKERSKKRKMSKITGRHF